MRTRWTSNREHQFVSRVAPDRVRNLRAAGECELTATGVDVVAGRVLLAETDATLPGALPIVFERFYSSAWSHRDSPLGYGWSHPYAQTLFVEPGRLVWRGPDGREIEFDLFAAEDRVLREGDAVAAMRGEARLRALGARAYRVETPEGTVYHFGPVPGADARDHTAGVEPEARLLRVEARNGSEVRVEHDAAGRIVALRNSAGRALFLEHDDEGRLRAIATPAPPRDAEVLCTYEYSPAGDLLSATRPGDGAATRYLYASHLLTRRTDAGGYVRHYGYDAIGSAARCIETWGTRGTHHAMLSHVAARRATTWTDPLGGSRVLVADVVHALKRCNRVEFTHDAWFRTVSARDPAGVLRRVERDPWGRALSLQRAGGPEVTFAYDPRGNLERVVAPGGSWRWRYDRHGAVVEEADPLGERAGYECAQGLTRAALFAARGRWEFDYQHEQLVAIARPDGARVQVERDARGRVTRVVDPSGYGTRFEYDRAGRVAASAGDDGVVRRYTRDAMGRVTEAHGPDGSVRWRYMLEGWVSSRREPDGRERACRYNVNGALASVRSESQDFAFLHYDKHGRVEREVGFDGAARRYLYDPRGRVRQVQLPGRVKVTLTRDDAGRVVEVSPRDGRVERYEYGADARLARAEVAGVRVEFQRDALGRVVREQQGEHWVDTVYDAAGERVETRSSLGARVVFLRDDLGRVTTAWMGEPRYDEWHVDLAYDLAGRLAQQAFPGRVVASWERDGAGRPLKHTILAGGRPALERAYARDNAGRVTNIVDTRFGPMALERDAAGRLQSWTERGARMTRAMDAVGDVFRTRDGSDADYTAGGRVVRADDVRYRHDARGFPVSARAGSAAAMSLRWTSTGLLASLTLPDGRAVSYEYDAFGRRVRKTVGEQVTRYVWDGDVLLHELSSDEGLTTWLWLPGTYQLLGRARNGRKAGVVTDQVGAPLALFESDGTVTWSGLITPWGDCLTETEDNSMPWRFAGHYHDADTGMLASRHRYYVPALGRYLDPHPLGLHGGTNPYAFVDDPVSEMDPLGLRRPGPAAPDEAALRSLEPRWRFLLDRITGDIAGALMRVDDPAPDALIDAWGPRTDDACALETDAPPPGWQGAAAATPRMRTA